jgi:glycerol-3-phosphate acyltransferase PlsX
MRIGIDAMGGDYAPVAVISGALLALRELAPDQRLVLFGPEDDLRREILAQGGDCASFDFVHAPEVIGMSDHPAKSFAQKTLSGMALGYNQLLQESIDGFASAGNTGAMPRPDGSTGILLDVGINADCRPDVLYQYAILGSLYAEHVFGISNPRIGLINIGSEEEKGNLLTKASHELMKGSPDFNFIGNIEGNDIFRSDKADVMICDGFTGNVMLKLTESIYSLIRTRNIVDEYFERFNFENYGGTPILGINGVAVIAHGASNAIAIKNMIIHTKNVIHAGIPEKIKQFFK